MSRKNLFGLMGVLVVLSLVLGACTTPTPEVVEKIVEKTVEVEVEKIVEKTVEVEKVVEKIVEVEVTAEPEPVGPKVLVVCQGQEPDTLYVNGGTMLAGSFIKDAFYDGPIDNRTYAYQAVILEKLPSLDDGDAVVNAVMAQTGDMVVDDNGDNVELEEGMLIRPAGCRSTDCAVEFDGTPLELDQMVATFKLVEGLSWSNGDPLTADDSVYQFELVADPDTAVSKFTIDRTASYEAVDDMTTVWTGLPGYIDSTFFANFWQPMPRKLWQEELGYSAADLLEAEESSRLPMGWGAFVITEWVAGDHITVEKNPLYFRADEGLPYVDTVIYRFVSDANAAVAQLISGECARIQVAIHHREYACAVHADLPAEPG